MIELFNHHANTLYPPPPSANSQRPERYQWPIGSNFLPPIIGHRTVTAAGPLQSFHCNLQHLVVETDVIQQYQRLVEAKIGLETRDHHGHTSLYFVIAYTPAPKLFEIAALLLDCNASTQRVNNFGENCLHLLLKRLSACSTPDDVNGCASATRRLLLALLVRLLRGQEGQEALMRHSDKGITPADAALSPAVWPVFCEAMRTAGYNIALHLAELDARDGLNHSLPEHNEAIKELCRRFQHQRLFPGLSDPSTNPMNTALAAGQARCYVCWKKQSSLTYGQQHAPPFDQFVPVMIHEQELDMHAIVYEMGLSKEEMSWRRWAALWLWERDKLRRRV